MGYKNKARNTVRVAKGTVEEVAGRTAGDERLEADGRRDQTVGRLDQVGEKVRDVFKK